MCAVKQYTYTGKQKLLFEGKAYKKIPTHWPIKSIPTHSACECLMLPLFSNV